MEEQVARIIATHTSKAKDSNETTDKTQRTLFHAVLESNLEPSEKTVERLTDVSFLHNYSCCLQVMLISCEYLGKFCDTCRRQ